MSATFHHFLNQLDALRCINSTCTTCHQECLSIYVSNCVSYFFVFNVCCTLRFSFVFSHFHSQYCMLLYVAQFFDHNFPPEQTFSLIVQICPTLVRVGAFSAVHFLPLSYLGLFSRV